MSLTDNKESNFATKTTATVGTDFTRTIIDGISTKMTMAKHAELIASTVTGAGPSIAVRTIVSAGTVALADNLILCDCTAGNITLTMLDPATAWDSSTSKSRIFYIMQSVDASNTLTIAQFSSENFYYAGSAASSIALTSGGAVAISTDGTNWFAFLA